MMICRLGRLWLMWLRLDWLVRFWLCRVVLFVRLLSRCVPLLIGRMVRCGLFCLCRWVGIVMFDSCRLLCGCRGCRWMFLRCRVRVPV